MLIKSEILRKQTDIDRLFEQGRKITAYPLMLIWRKPDEADEKSLKVLFSVPKRRFKLAVDRNRLRRRLREAYRLNKDLLNGSRGMHLALVYTGREEASYRELEAKIIVLLKRLSKPDEETVS